MSQKIAIFRRGEGSEELFFEGGNIINHCHEFTEITGTLKILKDWLIKVNYILDLYTLYSKNGNQKMSFVTYIPS